MEIKEQHLQTSCVADDFISFKSECDCFAHDLKIIFEKDKDFDFVSLSFEDTMYFDEYTNGGFFSRIWFRIKMAFQFLFKGYVEFDYEFVFKNKDHIDEFMKYMNNSYKKINLNNQDKK